MRTSGYLLYTAGQLGVMMLTRFFFLWVIKFAHGDGAQAALLAGAAMSFVLLGFRVFDAVVDPLVGAAGDAWVRSGRQRRNLLWFALPLPSLGLALIFAPTMDMEPALRWTCFGAGMFLFFGGYSFYSIPFWSMIGDYAQGDTSVRTRLSNAQGVGLLLATAVGFVISPSAVKHFGFHGGAIIFGLAAVVLMAMPYFAAPKGFASRPPDSTSDDEIRPWAAMAQAFKNKRFRGVIVLFVGVQMSLTIMTGAAPFIAERLLLGSLDDVPLLLGPFLLSTLFFFTFVRRWATRFGWERVVLFGSGAMALAYIGTGFLGQGLIGSPFVTAMVVFASAGPGAAIILGLEAEAVVRCASEAKQESTGSYFGLFNMIVQGMNGIALAITNLLADKSHETVLAVRAMPIVAGILCVAAVVSYLVFFKGQPVAAAEPSAS